MMLNSLKQLFKRKVSDKKEKYVANNSYSDGETCQEVIDNIHRPFGTSDLKYYPHHGLYKKRRWDGAITSTKGGRLIIPCGMGDKKPKDKVYIKEFSYEVIYNIMHHTTVLSDGSVYTSKATFPKTTDSYLFSGIIAASNKCLENALKERIGSIIEFN